MRNEIFAERAEATFFSKLDASAGIWQSLLSTGLQIYTWTLTGTVFQEVLSVPITDTYMLQH